jgi:hypothetical protein
MGEGLCRLIGLNILCRWAECAKPDAEDARTFALLRVVPLVPPTLEGTAADEVERAAIGALEPR